MSATLQIGKTYRVNSSRKGLFDGVLVKLDSEWAEILITKGKARAMLEYNEREPGETVTVRRSFCSFSEIEGGAA